MPLCPFCTDENGRRVKLKVLKRNKYKKNNGEVSSGILYLCPVCLDEYHVKRRSNGRKRTTYLPKGEKGRGKLIDHHLIEA